MAIAFNCPHCGELHRVKDEFAGKLAKCKRATCRKQVLIPLRSTVMANGNGQAPAKPVDAESLAAAAFAEDAPAVREEPAVAKKMLISCTACDHLFEVDSAMQGKNTRCPECNNVFRVAKIIEEKTGDWRDAHKKKPSLAKVDEPAPEGVWDVQRRGVSSEAIRQTEVEEYEDDEQPIARRIRQAKTVLYTLALVGMLVGTVIYLVQSRVENKREELMAKGQTEIKEGENPPEFLAALNRFAAEFALRDLAKKREGLEEAKKLFEDARGKLHPLPAGSAERAADCNAMLVELGLSQAFLAGGLEEINSDRRLSWDKVQPEIRRTFNFIDSSELDLRKRALTLLAQKLAEKDQGIVALNVARNCTNESEFPEVAGRIGIALFLAGKKDAAAKVLKDAGPKQPAPALTALWLALNPDKDEPDASFVHVPRAKSEIYTAQARLAYAEGKALQGKFEEARRIAEGADPKESVDAQILVAQAAAALGKSVEAGAVIDNLAAIDKKDPALIRPWQLVRVVELAAQSGKMNVAESLIESMKGNPVEPWARLQVQRIKLAAQPKQKSDDTGIEAIPVTRLPAAIARAELARHNAAAGDSTQRKMVIDQLPKGTIRPFGYAGMALGEQDRNVK